MPDATEDTHMPLAYRRDDASRRIVATGVGAFRADEVLAVFDRMRAEGVWTYGALYDLRQMTGRPTRSDLERVLDGAGRPGPGGERPGPTAVLAVDPGLYASACAYSAMGPPTHFNVFSDRIEAEAWLVMHTAVAPLDR
jgi:hypothetical protein